MNATTDTDEERIARAELTWIAEPRDRLLRELVRAPGAVKAMALIRAGRLPHDAELTANPGWQQAMARWHAALERVPPRGEVERTLVGRFRLVYPGCAEWPGGLDRLGDAAPVALWVTGVADLGFSCRRSAAVTGARAATAYGAYLGSEFGGSLADRGWTVVSGASFGIDASAHRGALGAGGVTIAVAAGGLDEPYPAAHIDLFGAIAAQGALVSEAPPGGAYQQAPVRGPAAGHRRACHRDGDHRGGRPQRRADRRPARPRHPAARDGGARAGDLRPVVRMPRADPAPAGRPGHLRQRRDQRTGTGSGPRG